jgi:excisionase family DNA binding protein
MEPLVILCDTCGEALGNPQCTACRRYSHPAGGSTSLRPEPVPPGSGPVQRERRQPERQRPVLGGARKTDPPLTTRDCADYMGLTTEFIRGAIEDGQLEAEDVIINGRRVIRIHLDQFVAYLKSIKWKRLPKLPREAGDG